jgi:hypothetical protein
MFTTWDISFLSHRGHFIISLEVLVVKLKSIAQLARHSFGVVYPPRSLEGDTAIKIINNQSHSPLRVLAPLW